MKPARRPAAISLTYPLEHTRGGRQSSLARWAALCPIIFNALENYKHRTGYHPRALLDTTSKPPV